MEKEKKTIKKDKLVPYRRYGLFQKNEKKYMYLLDQNIVGKMHYKLYYDIVEWFWNNADEVVAHDDVKYPKVMKVSTKSKKLLNIIDNPDYPYYNIDCFITDGKVEFLDHDGYLQIQIYPKRVELLRDWLESKGWLRDAIICPEECPAFTRYSEEKKRIQVLIIVSLIEWEGYPQITRDEIIQKFEKNGATFYNKAGSMKLKENSYSAVTHPSHFYQMDPDKDYF